MLHTAIFPAFHFLTSNFEKCISVGSSEFVGHSQFRVQPNKLRVWFILGVGQPLHYIPETVQVDVRAVGCTSDPRGLELCCEVERRDFVVDVISS